MKHQLKNVIVMGVVSGLIFSSGQLLCLDDKDIAMGGLCGAFGNIVLADPFTSASKAIAASSLTAKTAQSFKKRQLAAALTEGVQLLLNLIAAAPLEASAAYYFNTTDDVKKIAVYSAWLVAALLFVLRSRSSIRSIFQHVRYAKNAEQLHGLLQDEDFKNNLGVTDWAKVRNRRQLAEAVSTGVAAGFGGGIVANNILCFDKMANNYAAQFNISTDAAKIQLGIATALAFFSPLAVKPIISRLIRQKSSARDLEAAFDRAIRDQNKAAAA